MLKGGAGDDILVGGGDGNDGTNELLGGTGRDILVAHYGSGTSTASTLKGEAGEDILIAGTYSSSNLSGIFLIRNEWSSPTTSHQDRIDHILGAPGGLNQGSYPIVDGLNANLLDNGAVVEVFGGNDLEWFFIEDDIGAGLSTDIANNVSGEAVSDLD